MTMKTKNARYLPPQDIRFNAPVDPTTKEIIITDSGTEKLNGKQRKYHRVILHTNITELDRGNDRIEMDKWILNDEKGDPIEFGMRFGHVLNDWANWMGTFVDVKPEYYEKYNANVLMGTGIYAPKREAAELYDAVEEGLIKSLSIGMIPVAPPEPITDPAGRRVVGQHYNKGHRPIDGSWVATGDDIYAQIVTKGLTSIAELIEEEAPDYSEQVKLAYRQGYETACQEMRRLLVARGIINDR